MRIQELLGTWRIPKLDLRKRQCFSFITCLIKWKTFYLALWLFPNSLFYLSIRVFKLLDSLLVCIWAMFACSQSQKVLVRKWKLLFKFWSLLVGISDWTPSLEFIPSNVRQFFKTQSSSVHSPHEVCSFHWLGRTCPGKCPSIQIRLVW